MKNKVNSQPDAELAPETDSTVIDTDPAELEQVPAIDPPIWEEIIDPEADRETAPDLAETVGIESIGGTITTPDWNVVDDLADSVGISMPDREILHTSEVLDRRDTNRWELDPQSAEDY